MACSSRVLAVLAAIGLLLATAEAERSRRPKRRSSSGRSCSRQFRALTASFDGANVEFVRSMGKNRKNKKQAYRMIASCNGDQLFRATCTNGRVSYKSLLEESPSRPDLVGSYAGPLVDPAWVSKQDSCVVRRCAAPCQAPALPYTGSTAANPGCWINSSTAVSLKYEAATEGIFASVVFVDGNLTILDSKSGTLRGLGRLESVAGVLWINNASIVSTAGLVSLQRVGGIRIVGSNAALKSVSFPALTTVSNFLNIQNNAALESVSFPALTTVSKYLNVADNAALAALLLPVLRSVGGFLQIFSNGLSEYDGIPKLACVEGPASPAYLTDCSTNFKDRVATAVSNWGEALCQ